MFRNFDGGAIIEGSRKLPRRVTVSLLVIESLVEIIAFNMLNNLRTLIFTTTKVRV